MDVRGKDSGKDKHSQVCMRSPMESMWTDDGGWARAPKRGACSKEAGDWEDREMQGHIDYHLVQGSRLTKMSAWWDQKWLSFSVGESGAGLREGEQPGVVPAQVLSPVGANQRFSKEKC